MSNEQLSQYELLKSPFALALLQIPGLDIDESPGGTSFFLGLAQLLKLVLRSVDSDKKTTPLLDQILKQIALVRGRDSFGNRVVCKEESQLYILENIGLSAVICRNRLFPSGSIPGVQSGSRIPAMQIRIGEIGLKEKASLLVAFVPENERTFTMMTPSRNSNNYASCGQISLVS